MGSVKNINKLQRRLHHWNWPQSVAVLRFFFHSNWVQEAVYDWHRWVITVFCSRVFIGLLQSFVLSCSLGYYCLLPSSVHWVISVFCPLVFTVLLLCFALSCSFCLRQSVENGDKQQPHHGVKLQLCVSNGYVVNSCRYTVALVPTRNV